MRDLECDACVVGGGPAGAIAAFRLATLGHRVCLVECQTFPRPHVGESLSAGIWPLLDSLGLRGIIARPSFRAPGETLLCWAGSEPERVPSREKTGGLLVDRGEFDALLLQAARLAGACIIQPARAQVARVPEGWRIKADGMEAVSISAKLLIDAAGRKACLPGRRTSFSPPTLALWAHLETESDSLTRVEAIPEGWIWAAPIAERRVSIIHFCDPSHVRRRLNGNVECRLREQLAKTVLFSGFTQAPFPRGVVLRDATCTSAVEPIGPDYLRVGEANYSLDPLSSTGVEKALQSALIGALAAHTLLHHPERAKLCARYYIERQQETIATHTAWSNRYYREVTRYADKPFWAARRTVLSSTPAARLADPPLAPQAATPVRLAPEVSFAEEPCIVGEKIDTRVGLRSAALARPLVYLDGIEIAPLLMDAALCPTWRDLLTRWSQRVPRSRAERIAGWLWEKRILCERPANRSN